MFRTVLVIHSISVGLINDDGSINWGCPCLGGMATGPCGPEFREAFSCFHNSEAEPKGSDCYEQFRTMQQCMSQYPTLYDTDKDDDEELEELEEPQEGSTKQEVKSAEQEVGTSGATSGDTQALQAKDDSAKSKES